jgi:hypothetical protein
MHIRTIRRPGLVTTIAALAIGLGTAGTASAGDLTSGPGTPPPPPPRTGTLVSPTPGPSRATTCEGARQCDLLGDVCGFAGGTYSEWDSSDHGHPHGICTWPWE